MQEEGTPKPSEELITAQSVHELLLRRFGAYRTSDWQPSQDNVVIMSDQEFEDFQFSKIKKDDFISEEQRKAYVRDILTYADFDSKKLYMRSSQAQGDDFRQTVAHEMLHLWFLRDVLIANEPDSYGVNETFIETLALEALGLYGIPKEGRSEHVDNAINNTIIVKSVFDRMGDVGWKEIFNICQNGDEWNIRKSTKEKFGAQPPTKELRKINVIIPEKYGKKFWDRLKEVALISYYQRQDPNFLNENKQLSINLELIVDWSQVRDQV